MISRRRFLQTMGAAGVAAALPVKFSGTKWLEQAKAWGYVPPLTPPPWPSEPYPATPAAVMAGLTKYTMPLLSSVPVYTPRGTFNGKPLYVVQMAQTSQTLHTALPPTPVFCYGQLSLGAAGLHYPGYSFEARAGQGFYVRYINQLPANSIMPHDPAVNGASGGMMPPLGGPAALVPAGTPLPENRAVVHLHGANVKHNSDGWPDFWLDPQKVYSSDRALYYYPNAQPGATLWYHDHAMACTRLNVHAGLAGFYFIRDAKDDALNIPKGQFEVPIVIQDRMFNADGTFLFPSMGSGGMPNGTYPNYTWPSGRPVWVPEYFGDVAVVNGAIWPNMDVQQRRYRFRFLNGCNARFLNLYMQIGSDAVPAVGPPAGPFLSIYQIATDGGFLPKTIKIVPTLDPVTGGTVSLFMPPAFRCDTIVDFSKLAIGTKVYLVSDAVGPWPGGGGNVLNQIMSFTVTAAASPADTTGIPATPNKGFKALNPASAVATRYVTLNEWLDAGTASSQGMQLGEGLGPERFGLDWSAPVTITPALNTVEIWNFVNRTGDGHPMHLHLVQFQVLDRFAISMADYDNLGVLNEIAGTRTGPQIYDQGWKDTVLVPPGDGVTNYMVTRIIARFGSYKGVFPYHCHIIDHEDNAMMRFFQVI